MASPRPWILAALALAACSPPPDAPATDRARQPLGEPQGAFPDWTERAVHVLTNRARCDPAAALAPCAQSGRCADHACYQPMPPLAWALSLNRAARFHAAHLQASRAGLQHDSPCTLRADIGQQYTPGPCDGDPACACEGGATGCQPGGCTSFGARLGLFGVSRGGAENAAPNGDPEEIFLLWLHEPDGSPACGWRVSNGHRANILNPALTGLGVGAAGAFMTQDFSFDAAVPPLPAGIHLPQQPRPGQTTTFLVNHYLARGGQPSRAQLILQGQCHDLTLERGAPDNGTWRWDGPAPDGCVSYYFLFDGPQGELRYPSEGSLQVGCGALYADGQEAPRCDGEPRPAEDMGAVDAAQDGVEAPDEGSPDAAPDAAPDLTQAPTPEAPPPDGFVGQDGFVGGDGEGDAASGCASGRSGDRGVGVGQWRGVFGLGRRAR